MYMFEDTGLDASHEGAMKCTVAEKTNGVLGQKLRRVRATTMACRGKLRRVGVIITACRGKLRRVGPNYGVSGQITAYRGKLCRVGQ